MRTGAGGPLHRHTQSTASSIHLHEPNNPLPLLIRRWPCGEEQSTAGNLIPSGSLAARPKLPAPLLTLQQGEPRDHVRAGAQSPQPSYRASSQRRRERPFSPQLARQAGMPLFRNSLDHVLFKHQADHADELLAHLKSVDLWSARAGRANVSDHIFDRNCAHHCGSHGDD